MSLPLRHHVIAFAHRVIAGLDPAIPADRDYRVEPDNDTSVEFDNDNRTSSMMTSF